MVHVSIVEMKGSAPLRAGRMIGIGLAVIFLGAFNVAEAMDNADSEGKPTPPVQVDQWDLEKDFAKINQQWASVFAVLENEKYFDIGSDDVSAWSCGQQAGHIALVMESIADGIQENLADPNRNAEGTLAAIAPSVLTGGVIPRGVGQAPEGVKPGGRGSEELLELLKSSRKKWQAIEARSAQLGDCPARFPHFAFGQLTSTDWVRFAAIHTAHHLKIIRDILKKSGPEAKGFGGELMAEAGS